MLINRLKLYPNQSQRTYGAAPATAAPIATAVDGINTGPASTGSNAGLNSNTPNPGAPPTVPNASSNNNQINNSIQGNPGIQLQNSNTARQPSSGTTGTSNAAAPILLPPQFIPTGSIVSNAYPPQPPFIPTNIQQEYIANGLTFISNNPLVNKRNTAGNLLFEENSQNNENIYIESIIETYTNKSFIEAVDTQFNYFKFPAIIGVDSTLDLTFNANFDVTDTGVDPVSGFHVINTVDANGVQLGDYIDMTPFSYNSDGMNDVLFNKTLGGAPIDADLNAVVLTPEKIKYVRETNQAIKITVRTTFRPQTENNTGFVLGLQRKMPVVSRDWPANAGGLYRKRVYDYETSAQQGGGVVQDHFDTYIGLKIVYVIDPDDMFDYDQYVVDNISGGPGWYLRQTAFLQFDLIDDPGPSGYGKQ